MLNKFKDSYLEHSPGDNWRERGYAGVVFGPTDLCIRPVGRKIMTAQTFDIFV